MKLSNSQMLALTDLIGASVQKYSMAIESVRDTSKAVLLISNSLMVTNSDDAETEVMEINLYKSIFEDMHLYLQRRILIRQRDYNLNLKPHWAFAFHLEYSGLVDISTQAGHVAQTICNLIHKKYA